MSKVSIGIGVLLVVLGVSSFIATQTSITALIPAFFGVPIMVLGIVAFNPRFRKHAMHVAMLIALIGIGGAGQRLMAATEWKPLANGSQLAMVVLCAVYLGLGIKSFIDARRTPDESTPTS